MVACRRFQFQTGTPRYGRRWHAKSHKSWDIEHMLLSYVLNRFRAILVIDQIKCDYRKNMFLGTTLKCHYNTSPKSWAREYKCIDTLFII